MFFDKILDALKIENLFSNEPKTQIITQKQQDKEDNNILYIKQLIEKATDLSSIMNSTIDVDDFYSSLYGLISVLQELQLYEKSIPVSSDPSIELKNILENKDTIIYKFKQRCLETTAKKKLETEQTTFNIPQPHSYDTENVPAPEPYESDRILIKGLHPLFISILRDIIESQKIIPVALMREYRLTKEDLQQILSEGQDAHLIDENNNILVTKEFYEKFIDHYEPSLYKCEHSSFDKELLICIGEITIENGAESLYEEFDSDNILDYLNILEHMGVIKYSSANNSFESLISLDEFRKKCLYIPDSSKKIVSNLQMNIVDKMEGHDFEYFCANILKKNGFSNVEVTQGSGDHGIDILADKEDISYAIQCKCYSSNIGNTAVQQVHTGKSLYHKDIAVILTNQYFTTQAKEEANALGVKLWDRNKLEEMIKRMS